MNRGTNASMAWHLPHARPELFLCVSSSCEVRTGSFPGEVRGPAPHPPGDHNWIWGREAESKTRYMRSRSVSKAHFERERTQAQGHLAKALPDADEPGGLCGEGGTCAGILCFGEA